MQISSNSSDEDIYSKTFGVSTEAVFSLRNGVLRFAGDSAELEAAGTQDSATTHDSMQQ